MNNDSYVDEETNKSFPHSLSNLSESKQDKKRSSFSKFQADEHLNPINLASKIKDSKFIRKFSDPFRDAMTILDPNAPSRMEKEWSSYNPRQKIVFVILAVLKIFACIIFLFGFLLSLKFMTIGFTMISTYVIHDGSAVKYVLSNPFAALAIGIFATALMQNAT